MNLPGTQPRNGRRARHVLDCARNPRVVSLHAARRFIEDAMQQGVALSGDDVFSAIRQIEDLCRRARKLYRGKNSYILHSPPWWVFYRDGTVVTVLHANSQRKKF